METIIDGCRLCLESFAENSFTIESPDLKQQMQNVFQFVIEYKKGYPTKVCQSCTYTISEFYKYSEKVRLNQEKLNNGRPNEEYKFLFEVVTINTSAESKYFDHTDLSTPLPDRVAPPNADVEDTGIDEKNRHSDEPSNNKKQIPTGKCDVDNEGLETNEVEANEPSKILVSLPEESESENDSIEESNCHESDTEPKKPNLIKDTDERKQNNRIPGKHKAKRNQDDIQFNEFFRMTCDLCGDLATNFSTLLKHFQKNHTRPGYIICCKTKLFRRAQLLHHMALHMNPNAFRCELCNRSYKSKEYLHHHNVRVHGNGSDHRAFKCDFCSQSFAKKCLLRTHSCKLQKVECPQCGKKLSKGALRLHLTNMHSKTDRKMICDTCGQAFLNKVCFENHIKMHMGIEVKRFQCQICQKWIKGEHDLQRHIRIIHYEKEQTHICDICNKQYPNTKALKKHKGIVHVEGKFECEFCGKKFKQALNLKEHRTIHTGEVLYSCDICGMTMNSKANFYNHTKKSHPEEWAEKRLKAAEANIPNKQT